MNELNWVHTGVVLLMASTVFYLIRIFKPSNLIHDFGWGFMLLSLVCLAISLVIRSINADYFALSNMYESLLVVSMGIQLAFLVADRWFSGVGNNGKAVRALGLPVGLLLIASLLFNLSLPTEIRPLQPALQSYWRSIHVPIILLSYALFTLAFLSSVVYLVKYYLFEKPGHSGDSSGNTPQLATDGPLLQHTNVLDTLPMDLTAAEAIENDSASIYDEITYRCVAFGFPMLTLGIILGGIWANEAWGNYWSWDPKESMSLVTLLGYGVYLHMRVNGEHHVKTLAWISVAGFVLMLITYFGVNLMGLGLHSYGKIG